MTGACWRVILARPSLKRARHDGRVAGKVAARQYLQLSRGKPEKIDPADIAGVIFDDEDISLGVHGDAAHLADFIAGRIEPLAVVRVIAGLAVNEDVQDARRIDVKDLAPLISARSFTSL